MSSETLYKQTRDKLYNWLNEVFEISNKITIDWRQDLDRYVILVSQNSSHLIEGIELGKGAEEKLEKIKSGVLGLYAMNPRVCNINEDKLTDKERGFLVEEVKRHLKTLKEQNKPYEDLLYRLQHPLLYRFKSWIYGKLKKI